MRSHPDTLIVTARNKMGTGASVVVSIGLASRLIETHTLRRDDESLGINREAARRLCPNGSGRPDSQSRTAERCRIRPGFFEEFRWVLS